MTESTTTHTQRYAKPEKYPLRKTFEKQSKTKVQLINAGGKRIMCNL